MHQLTPCTSAEQTEPSEQLCFGHSVTVCAPPQQPHRQQTEELPTSSLASSILTSDCLGPCLESASHCLSEPPSHWMRTILQHLETDSGTPPPDKLGRASPNNSLGNHSRWHVRLPVGLVPLPLARNCDASPWSPTRRQTPTERLASHVQSRRSQSALALLH